MYSKLAYVDLSQYQSDTKVVEVKGAVYAPGTYEVAYHATIAEIIEKAGGCQKEADLSSINQSLDVEHHGVVVIPTIAVEKKISINTASVEELDELPGVGPSIAQRIVDYRTQSPFHSLDQIKEVKGIGDAMFEKIKDLISL